MRPMNVREVAKIMSKEEGRYVSPGEICVIEREAMEKMRKFLREHPQYTSELWLHIEGRPAPNYRHRTITPSFSPYAAFSRSEQELLDEFVGMPEAA
jgi:hypothetical protein